MPSLGDSAVIIFIGLLLFGPKGLAQIARQIGKLMAEFRRASNEFRMQMEEELRISEQVDRQKQIAAVEAAAPAPPAILPSTDAHSAEEVEEHPHLPSSNSIAAAEPPSAAPVEHAPVPQPIATSDSGDLSIMPPSTGLPTPRRSSLAALIDSVPHVEPEDSVVPFDTENKTATEESLHG
jgi:sec-independent protein translocase protein TatB